MLKRRGIMRNGRRGELEVVAAGSALVLASLIVACGGSGSGCGGPCSTPPPPPPSVVDLRGCNMGATSVTESGRAAALVRRLPTRARQAAFIAGFIAIRFSGTGSEPEVGRALERVRAKQASRRNDFGYVTYTISASSDPQVVAAALSGTRGVAEVKPVAARYLEVIPNDTDFGQAPPYTAPQVAPVQWDMYLTQMPSAWNISEGSPSVRIAIIDSGYDANNVDICSKVVDSAVFDNMGGIQDTTASAQDDDGHGSNVSGIAASVTDNITRFAGIGWNVDLLEVRVFQQPSVVNPTPPGASSLDIAAGINWAVEHGANVINMSLGSLPGTPCNSSEQAAITNAVNPPHNVAVVVASGNDSSNFFGDPADCAGVIVAGASAIDVTNPSTPVEKVAGYSNYTNSKTWGIVAPGGEADPSQFTCLTGVPPCDYLQWIINNYSTTACCANSVPPNAPGHGALIFGTSMAAPHVAGVAALMISKDPGITPGLLASILETNTDDVCGGCVQEGAGRLNAAKALTATP